LLASKVGSGAINRQKILKELSKAHLKCAVRRVECVKESQITISKKLFLIMQSLYRGQKCPTCLFAHDSFKSHSAILKNGQSQKSPVDVSGGEPVAHYMFIGVDGQLCVSTAFSLTYLLKCGLEQVVRKDVSVSTLSKMTSVLFKITKEDLKFLKKYT
jgi:hypothetical protein